MYVYMKMCLNLVQTMYKTLSSHMYIHITYVCKYRMVKKWKKYKIDKWMNEIINRIDIIMNYNLQ